MTIDGCTIQPSRMLLHLGCSMETVGFVLSLQESNMTRHEAGEETENYLLHFESLARTEIVWVC